MAACSTTVCYMRFCQEEGREIIYRSFADLKLSGLGLGAMRLPTVDQDDSVIDEPAAMAMIDYAMEHGVNYYDTAWGYHGGHSEEVLGRALAKYPRESFYLATKFPGYDNPNFGKVEQIFEEQLKKAALSTSTFTCVTTWRNPT